MALKLFNTLSRAKQQLTLKQKTAIKLYTCGPTVYAYQHIGNFRTYIFEDILRRTLLINGYRARHIMNITDVGHLVSNADEGEDKIAQAAAREHKTAYGIAQFYENAFKKDLKALNIFQPTKFVRATLHIKEQIRLIKTLEKKRYTYRTSDGIYFDTSRLADYGKLAPRNIKGIRRGARVSIREKRNSTDFALWKFSPANSKREMEWKSPWGMGFPGWHIECSAMSMKYLGPMLDIHCGGVDHIQIHHTNEIAQSEAATGKPFSKFWMHGAFLTIRGAKMAKSSPETNITLATLRKRGYDPLDFRYLTLGTHYRKPLSFGWDSLAGARTARLKILSAFHSLPPRRDKSDDILKQKFLAAMNDDLNTPRALAIFWDGFKKNASREFVLWCDHVLGLAIKKTSALNTPKTALPRLITELARCREALRLAKKWSDADALRKKMNGLGYRVKDTPSGPVIHRL